MRYAAMSGVLAMAGVLCCAPATASAAVTFDWVTVGNINNGPDTVGYGSVDHVYQITKTEVTNAQYAEFLNLKAKTDSHALYIVHMSDNAAGGITQSGVSGSFTYAVKSGYENQPVVYVSFYDSIRFINWLNNGQGDGDTETGAYTLTALSSVTRNPGASIFLPSEDEWYKAAYYDPTKDGTGGYWKYATQSDDAPTSQLPPGGTNSANYYYNDNIANGVNSGSASNGDGNQLSTTDYLTNVGAYTGSQSHYGTLDQSGNVSEWNEEIIGYQLRGIRGGSYAYADRDHAGSDYRPTNIAIGAEYNVLGFRVAQVPEPASIALLALCGGCLLTRRRANRI
jgi:formylglycine-generating enzyme required for sulfatase activity